MADDDIEIDGEEGGRSTRMMLVIGIVLGLVIGGGGAFFAATQMMASDDGAVEEVVEEEPEEEPNGAALGSLNIVYLHIERLPAPLLDSRGRTVGYVFLDLSLEMGDGEMQSYVSARMPRIKDAFLRAISKNGLTKPGTNGVIDYDRVSEYLKNAGNAIVGAEYIKSVYISRALRAPT